MPLVAQYSTGTDLLIEVSNMSPYMPIQWCKCMFFFRSDITIVPVDIIPYVINLEETSLAAQDHFP